MDAALRGAAARVAERRHQSFADTVETMLDELEHALPGGTAFFCQLEEEQGPLRVVESRGEVIEGLERGAELFLDGQAGVPEPELLRALGVRSFVGVPLETTDSRRVGSLCAASTSSGLYDQTHLDLLTVLARLLAGEIEIVRSRAELQRLTELVRDPEGTHPLTGLADRGRLVEWVRHERSLSRRGTHRSYLLTIRLQGVRAVRAEFGDAMAELLVKDAAETLRATFRETDHCGHVSDEMFAAVLVGCETSEHALIAADRFRAVLARVAEARPVSLKLAFATRPLDDPAPPAEALAAAEAEAREAEGIPLTPEPVELPA